MESHIYYACRFAFNDDFTAHLRARIRCPNLPTNFTFGSYSGQVAFRETDDVIYIAIYPNHLQEWKEQILDQHIDFLSAKNLLFKNKREREDVQVSRLRENTSPKNIGNRDLPCLRPPPRYDPLDNVSVSPEMEALLRRQRMLAESGIPFKPTGPFL